MHAFGEFASVSFFLFVVVVVDATAEEKLCC